VETAEHAFSGGSFQSIDNGGLYSAIVAVFTRRAKADEWNNKTLMTFSGQWEFRAFTRVGCGVLPARYLCI
jgi:hypothetical protein